MELEILKDFNAPQPAKIKIPKISKLFAKYEVQIDEFKVGPWGSCQYWTAWVTYDFCSQLIKEIGFDNFCALIKIPNGPWKPEADIIAMLREDLVESNKNWTEPEDSDMLIEIPDELTFAAYAELTKGNSWDLWSAYLPFWAFLDMEPDKVRDYAEVWDKPLESPTRGPMLNMMCQEENDIMGISIAIMEHVYPSSADADWADYDT